MATMNYNELTNCAEIVNGSVDPMFYYDARFPERTSQLHMRIEEPIPVSNPGRRSRARTRRDRNSARYKTQPITFDEIQEVDEETTEESKEALRSQLTEFSRSMELLVKAPPYRRVAASTTAVVLTAGSDTDSSGAASHDISPSPLASSASSLETSASTSRERFNRRRKKRFQRSIQEVPDIESRSVEFH